MRYVASEEFCAYIGQRALMQLTDSSAGTLNTELIEEVNEDAASEVDGYLRGVYDLPLAEPVDRNVKTLTADIMKFRLYKRRDEKNLPEEILKLYKMTIDKLRDIQARRFVLDAKGIGHDSVSEGVVRYSTPSQKFKNHFTGFDQ
ncbi:MAG: DUF1320 domain-containing protein [Rikenellaceae bacterium]|jgi:phage gp36-like protein|nr:DUF1320 domain-containing protein [Rikenellaceae bacterium]